MKKVWLAMVVVLAILLLTGAALANGTKTIYAKALDDHECDSTEWHFVITQISEGALAPSSIHVTWANGASENVSMWKFTGGVAHYVTTSNLGSTVTEASAEIYQAWSGQFNLSHGPCPPLCKEVDTHFGPWSEWSDWSECVDGEQTRTRTREVWTTDKYHPEVECDRWVETETETQWCDLCEEVDTHVGEWGPWSDWSECIDGEKSRTRSREIWTTDKYHPSVECDRWVETETQTIDCELCEEVDTHFGPWSEWSDWSECVDGEQTRTRTREVWTTDKYHPEVECDRWVETETETRACEEPTPTPTPSPEPGECNDVCEGGDCEEGLICYYGRCRDPLCPEKKDCVCPPCPNALLIKVVTRCGVGVSGVNVYLESGRGDRIPSPDKPPMLTDSTGTVVFSRDMGITPRDNKEWRIYLDGVLHDTFSVTECEQTITIYNELPCAPTPTPPPELPEELPVTGAGPPLATQATQSGVNPVLLIGLASIAIGAHLRRMRG